MHSNLTPFLATQRKPIYTNRPRDTGPDTRIGLIHNQTLAQCTVG